MSLQVQILLVLSGHPNGRASVADMNADLAVLAGAGPEWSQRVRRLASTVPGLDIFTAGYVVRDADGWSITAEGRKALQRMDKPVIAAEKGPALPVPPAPKTDLAIVARGQPAIISRSQAKLIAVANQRRLPRRAI